MRRKRVAIAFGLLALAVGILWFWHALPRRTQDVRTPQVRAREISTRPPGALELESVPPPPPALPEITAPPGGPTEAEGPTEITPGRVGRLGGRAIDPAGAPVAGVEIGLHAAREESPRNWVLEWVETTHTGVDGGYEFLPPQRGDYALWIHSGRSVGVLPARGSLRVTVEDEDRLDFDLPMEWADELDGTVTDLGGNPIAEALLVAGTSTALTDASGRYRLTALPREVPIHLVVTAEGYERQRRENVVAWRGDQDFRLAPRVGMVVLAEDPAGNPLPHFDLYARLDFGDALSGRFAEKRVRHPEGRQDLPQLNPGHSYHVEVVELSPEGERTGRHGAAFVRPAQDREEVRIRLGGEPFELWVLDGVQGEEPATGVEVTFTYQLDRATTQGWPDLRTVAKTHSDESGVATVQNLAPGIYRVVPTAPHLILNASQHHGSLVVRHEGLRVECAPALLRVSMGYPVRGRVLDGEDKPVPRRQVAAEGGGSTRLATTNAEGLFEFPRLPARELRIVPTGAVGYEAQRVTPGPEFDDVLEFRPAPLVLLHGEVVVRGGSLPRPIPVVEADTLIHHTGLFAEEGQHHTTVLPGTYRLSVGVPVATDDPDAQDDQRLATGFTPPGPTTRGYSERIGMRSFSAPFVAAGEPIRQRHDVNLRLGWIDVVAAEGVDITDQWNRLTIDQYCLSDGSHLARHQVRVSSNSPRIGPLIEGIYVVRTEEPEWSSGPVEVLAGDTGTIFLLTPVDD